MPEDAAIGDGRRQPVLLAKDGEPVLERRGGHGRLPGGLDQRAERAQAAATMTPRAELLEG